MQFVGSAGTEAGWFAAVQDQGHGGLRDVDLGC